MDIKEVAKKLGLDERSVENICSNPELVERILNENPIWLEDYLVKEKLPRIFIKRLIINNLVSYFQNSPRKGSKIFIFENEIAKFENDLMYNPIGYWNLIERQIKLLLEINKKSISENEYSLLSETLQGKATDVISNEKGLSKERVRQIIDKGFIRLKRKAVELAEIEDLTEQILALKNEVKALEIVIQNYRKVEKITDRNDENNNCVKTPIGDLDLSTRSNNCLKVAGILTLEDLITFTESDLIKIENMGMHSLKEIKQELKDRGLFLANSI